MNVVTLVGRLTKNPDMRIIPGSGTVVALFYLAINRNYTKKDGTKEVDFIPVEVVGKSAEYCEKYVKKGNLVSVEGSLRIDRYQNAQGENKTFTKVAGQNIKLLSSKNNDNRNNHETVDEDTHASGIFEENNGFVAIDDDEIPF